MAKKLIFQNNRPYVLEDWLVPFLEDDERFWEHMLLAQGMRNLQPVLYFQLYAQHSKVMTSVGLAEDKEGIALRRIQVDKFN